MTSMLGALCILVKHLKLRFLITYEGGSDQQIFPEFLKFTVFEKK